MGIRFFAWMGLERLLRKHSGGMFLGRGSVPSLASKQYNPNQIFRVGNGFGFFVYFTRYEYTCFANGWQIRPKSNLRGPRRKKKSK